MASILRVDTLTDASSNNSTAMSTINQGTAKAWANLNGSTFGLRDNFNVGSATDNGTGDYTFTFSSGLANTNYSAVVSSDDSGSSRAFAQSKTYATSSFVATTKRGDTGATIDKDIVIAAIHGDLA